MTENHRITALSLVLAAASLTALIAQVVQHQTIATGHKDVLLETTQSWTGKPYTAYPTGQPQLTMIKLTVAPHTALPWHSHPQPNVVYVLSGSLTLHDQATGKTLTLHAGQATGETVDAIHRGEAGDEPAVLLITYAGTKGTPTTIAAPGQQPEY